MRRIEEIDANFKTDVFKQKENTVIYNVLEEPFRLYGLIPPADQDDGFKRMPYDVAESVSEGVKGLNINSAGGRVRFKTNSSYIGILAKLGYIGKMGHFALTGSAGFDLYKGDTYRLTLCPPFKIENELFGEINTMETELTDWTINFPLYSQVKELYIILDKDATVEAPTPYRNEKPVVFYGSSITQGACASRPGTCYEAILSRNLNFDYINLGFSGNAKGEKEICDYIKNLDMSVFVYDYDHNAPTNEHLRLTHEPFFKEIRKYHPNIPIICLTKPASFFSSEAERQQVILNTVNNAKAAGDNNVYYLNMKEYFDNAGITNLATVDHNHPNDLGFFYMAKAVEEIMSKLEF